MDSSQCMLLLMAEQLCVTLIHLIYVLEMIVSLKMDHAC